MKNILGTLLIAVMIGTLQAETFTTADGAQIQGEIRRVEPDGLVVSTVSGTQKIKFKDLPYKVAQKYGYESNISENYQKHQLELQKAAIEAEKARQDIIIQREKDAEEEAKAKKQQALALRMASIEASNKTAEEATKNAVLSSVRPEVATDSSTHMFVFCEKIVDGGSLVHPARFIGGGTVPGSLSSMGGAAGAPVFLGTPVPSEQLIFVRGLTTLAEGNSREIRINPEGNYFLGQRVIEQWVLDRH